MLQFLFFLIHKKILSNITTFKERLTFEGRELPNITTSFKINVHLDDIIKRIKLQVLYGDKIILINLKLKLQSLENTI